jgi:hypothetical protein
LIARVTGFGGVDCGSVLSEESVFLHLVLRGCSMDPGEAKSEEVMLALPKTRLEVLQTRLQRLNADGSKLFQLPLDEVSSAEFRRPQDPRAYLFLGAAIGTGVIGHFVSQYNWLSCCLYVVGLFGGALAFFGWRKDQLVLQIRGAEMVVDCDEMANEVQCFVLALNVLLGVERNRAGER